MPKKVKKGVGMMEHTQVQYDLTAVAGKHEWQAFIDRMVASSVGFDEKRDKIATDFQAFLREIGVSDPSCVLTLNETSNHYSEDVLEHLIAKWLIEYHHLLSAREKLSGAESPTEMEYLVERAVTLGMIQERIWWRQGIDEQTGKRPETLALAGRRQVKNGRQGKEMQAADSFESMHLVNAQARADELCKSNPRWNYKRIQKKLSEEFKVSSSTLKRHLVNPLKKKGS